MHLNLLGTLLVIASKTYSVLNYHAYLFFKNLQLNILRRKISVEIEPAFSDGDTFWTLSDFFQRFQRRFVPGFGIVRVDTWQFKIKTFFVRIYQYW